MPPLVPPLATLRRRRSAKWRSHPVDVLPLPVAEMDYVLAEPVVQALREAIDRSDAGYAAPTRDLALALCGYAGRAWDWAVDPEHVRTVTDVGLGIVETLRRLVSPGDGVVLSLPVYEPFSWWIREVGALPVEAPLTSRSGSGGEPRLDLDALEEAFAAPQTVAYLLCNPHNPLGLVHSRSELAALAELADRYGVHVLSDEIHAPLTLPGAEFIPFLSVSDAARRRGFAFHSASKGWNLAGLKAATVVTAHPAPKRYVDRLSPHSLFRTGHLGVLATVAAYEHGDAWLAEVVEALDHNRRLLGQLLTQHLPRVGYRPPGAGFLAWLDFRDQFPRLPPSPRSPSDRRSPEARDGADDPAAHLLETARVALTSGLGYGTGGRGFARLNFACAPETLVEAVTRIASVVDGAGG
ncbi:aminotransferase class I/II-fold pyridoxal phosphate-dependent enzyme [Streptomyces sp. DW4-2]|uniref:cysteine-S-conjugate beta-lyase n=1 Tax=Streptomyces spirodelae TaxID=2812904 RepID=A0ABS3WPP8_9ACTN|nr:aminotransferase class I/II-fold pyridoxal phosphate-dependent enzyme [Streptomyces spirodelae]